MLVLAAILVAVPALASAQKKSITKAGPRTTVTATIQQIDSTTRRITFKNADGTEDSVIAGPEVQRFKELKVGDKVTLTYYESTIYQLHPASATAKTPSESLAVEPTTGKMPGGTMARQTVQTVTVKALDPSVPSITVTTSDGRTITRKVDKKSYLNGVNPGDKIDITYTEALLASVQRAK
jgi:hypothetical protein